MGDISTYIVALHRLDQTHKPRGGVCAFGYKFESLNHLLSAWPIELTTCLCPVSKIICVSRSTLECH